MKDTVRDLFHVVPMTEEDGQAICRWRYEPPYDLYNWDSWRNMTKNQYEFANPAIREQQYRSVTSKTYGLSGFAQFFPMARLIRLGLGMRPDLCGRGLGPAFVKSIVQAAKAHAPDDELDLEVLTVNIRAIKVYQKTGFIITDTYERMTPQGNKCFHCMVYQPN